MSPYRIHHGAESVAEEQSINLISNGAPGAFTLEFSYADETYTTGAIDLDASQLAVQSALDGAFDIEGANIAVEFWNGAQLRVSFGGTLVGEDVASLVVILQSEIEAAELEQSVVASKLWRHSCGRRCC